MDEGSSFTLSLADVHDPSTADTAAGFTVQFDCGGGFSPSGACTAVDDPSQAVRARIADKDGGETILSAVVTVANVAPSVTITAPASGALYEVGGTTPNRLLHVVLGGKDAPPSRLSELGTRGFSIE